MEHIWMKRKLAFSLAGRMLWMSLASTHISIVHHYVNLLASGRCGRHFNTLRPRQNGRNFADDIFKCIFVNENVWIPIKISPKFVPKGLINNIPALVQIMAWRRPGDKPLSEPMKVRLPTHICVTRPQWVKSVILEHILRIKFMSTSCEITFRWMPQNTFNDKSWLVQVTSHCLR